MAAMGALVGLLGYIVYLATKMSIRVNEGHVGVRTRFGAAEHLPGDPAKLHVLGPGLHFKWPWQKAIVVCVMEQNLELSGDTRGQQAMARDGTILRFDSILRYVPDQERLGQFLFGMKRPLEHITGLFSCLLRNEIANFPASALPGSAAALVPPHSPKGEAMEAEGSYALIRRERKLLNERIEDFCREKIGDRYGVRFNAVDLVDILPPDELADALNAVIQARAEAEAAYSNAEAECQQRVLSASEGVAIAQLRAEALQKEIETLAEALEHLQHEGTLKDYLVRRRGEVLAESRTVYWKENPS